MVVALKKVNLTWYEDRLIDGKVREEALLSSADGSMQVVKRNGCQMNESQESESRILAKNAQRMSDWLSPIVIHEQ